MIKFHIINNDLEFQIPDNLKKIYTDFEPLTTKIISERLCAGETFVDIGANFGYFSLLAASIVGPSGQVFSVEASPKVLPILQDNTSKFSNIKIINSAVGDRKGLTEFFLTEDYVNSGVSKSPFLEKSEKITIAINTIDDLLEDILPFDYMVDIMKCDVQGDEISVLKGAEKTINKSLNLQLIVEWAPAWMKNAGFDWELFPLYLRELGFSNIIVIDDYYKKQFTIDEMIAEFAKDTTGKRFCNILACKK